MDTIEIPIDPRDNKTPLVTNEMKAECIGEFALEVEMGCYDCEGEDCEICGGTGTYTQGGVGIPWTMVKDIYKRMALAASRKRESTGSVSAPTVKIDPVLEAIARKLFGFGQCPPMEQAKMIKRAAKAGADALRKQNKEWNTRRKENGEL